jgi:hypothetical protein
MLSTAAIQSVAQEVEAVGGPMEVATLRVPRGYRERVERAAKARGMTFSEYLRAVGWMASEPSPE